MGDIENDDILLARSPLHDFLLSSGMAGPTECSQLQPLDSSSPRAVLDAFRLDQPYFAKISDDGSQFTEDLPLGLPLCPKLSDEACEEGASAPVIDIPHETSNCEDQADGTDIENLFDDDSLSLSSVELEPDESVQESQLIATLREASPEKYGKWKRSEVLMLVRKGKKHKLCPKPSERPPVAAVRTTRKKSQRGPYKLGRPRTSWTVTQHGRGDVPLSMTCWDNEKQNKRDPFQPFEPKELIVQDIDLDDAATKAEIRDENRSSCK